MLDGFEVHENGVCSEVKRSNERGAMRCSGYGMGLSELVTCSGATAHACFVCEIARNDSSVAVQTQHLTIDCALLCFV